MTIQNFYDQIHSSYSEVFNRLGNEERIIRFVKRFFETGDIEALEEAIKKNDGNEAFEASHRLKGNSLNIGFTEFSHELESIVEPLRCRQITDPAFITDLFSKIKDSYQKIKNLSEQL